MATSQKKTSSKKTRTHIHTNADSPKSLQYTAKLPNEKHIKLKKINHHQQQQKQKLAEQNQNLQTHSNIEKKTKKASATPPQLRIL